MALDNAEFISELSVLDPPGTDPLNQGDDHIRTTKKAVQQSFPNVGSAVPQTGVQMAQMAIKNEANDFVAFQTFTAGATFVAPSFGVNWTFSGQVAFTSFAPTVGGVGVAILSTNTFTGVQTFQSAPLFQNDITLDSGGTTVINFDEGGVRRWQWLSSVGTSFELRRFVGGALIDAPMQFNNAFGEVTFLADASFNRTILVGDGSAGAPAYRFLNQTNSGMWRGSSTRLDFSVSGVNTMRLTTIQQQMTDGVEAFPAYSFGSDAGTGMWASATSCNLSANGQTIASFTSSSDIFAADGRSWAGNSTRTVARPSFNFNSDSDTGFYNPAANTIGIGTGGVAWGTIDSSALWLANGRSIHGDAAGDAGDPSYAFTNDTDTGMYRTGANLGALAAGGVRSFFWGNTAIAVDAGILCFFSLPTSPSTGGSLWNDGGTVKVA